MTYIVHVEHSQPFPDSVMSAIFSGAPWRFIRVPEWVERRGHKGLQRWVSSRVRHHYRENRGKLPLFGDITGYRLVLPDRSLMFDIHGKYIETRWEKFTPGSGSITMKGGA